MRFAIKFTISVLVYFSLFNDLKAIEVTDSVNYNDFELDEIVIRAKGNNKQNLLATNSELTTAVELTRAACCSLGESFTTNPSVDVNYTDAATGAKQIKLLGLSGSYVQMLLENIPNFRGVSSPYALDFIPGPWIQSIQISKGASSVKNGFESITGQINVELKKPQTPKSLNLNAYFDSEGRLEMNAAGNLHLGNKWSGAVLFNATKSFLTHDSNDDGFIDMPKVERLALVNRWAYMGERYIFQVSAKGLLETRKSGQIGHHSKHLQNPYVIDIGSKRLEFFTKNAFIIDNDNDSNIALILSGNVHDLSSSYGYRIYNALQYDTYASLMFERKWDDKHSLSTGLSFQYDNYRQHYNLINEPLQNLIKDYTHEAVSGFYGQYTYNKDDQLIAMGGIRFDYSSLYGCFITPRLHVKYNPKENWSFHLSAGMGRRSPHPLAEFNNYLASSRKVILPEKLKIEVGENAGTGFSWNSEINERAIGISGEYYFTYFKRQLTADMNSPHELVISCDSKGYSHNFQIEFNIDPIEDLSLTAAYRYSDVRVNYGNGYEPKPLSSAHRGLFTAGYSPFMGKWQFDLTLSINGGGYMPTPYILQNGELSWNTKYPAFCNLNFQVTRNFRKWSIYLGGENLTNYRQKNPIIQASDPWGKDFDATMVWGPLAGAMAYIGIRINL